MGALFEELCEYVGFGPDDWAALRALHSHAAPYFPVIVEEFYARLQAHPSASAVLRGQDQVERLKITLRGWLDRLLAGPWDEDYFELRSRIGRVHVRVKLPQRYMFTAMTLIRLHLMRVAETAYAGAPAALSGATRALSKVIDIELAIMLQTFREDSLAHLRRLERVEKHLLERRLEITEERYHAIVESAAVVVIVLDREFHVAVFNSAAERVSGYTREELTGADCVATLCHPQDAEVMRSRLEDTVAPRAPLPGKPGATPVIGGGDPRAPRHVAPFEARLKASTGEIRWLRWHLAPLPTGGGRQVCAIGVDLTEERKLADKSRRAENLAALGTLAAGLAHEIRNPLNAAQLQLTLVDRRIERDPSAARESAALVREELRRLAGLVEDFLAFARPTELRLGTADLCATVRSVADLLSPDEDRNGARLELRLPDAPVAARFDEERIKQVLINLIRNGFDAAGEKGSVTVALSRVADTVVLEVADTGPGLQEGIEIFEPFRTTKEEGTGLGLPIVHRITTDHEGAISVDRRDGLTVFTVELPIDGPD